MDTLLHNQLHSLIKFDKDKRQKTKDERQKSTIEHTSVVIIQPYDNSPWYNLPKYVDATLSLPLLVLRGFSGVFP